MDNQQGEWEALIAEGRDAFSREDFDLAERRFLDALRLSEVTSRQEQFLEKSWGLLAFFYCHRERYQEAERYWLKGLELLERTYSPEAQEVGTYIYNMAELVYRPWGKSAEADRLRHRAELICGEGFFRVGEPPAS